MQPPPTGHQPSKDQSQTNDMRHPPTDMPACQPTPLLVAVYGDGGSEVPWGQIWS